MDLQLLAKRRFYALTAALIIALLFLKFRTLSNLNSGISASGNHQRLSTSGPLRDIYNATLGFEKIFVVGLPSRSDRRDGMTLQAALSDMQLEFIDGVMGQDVPDKAVPMAKDKERLRDASIGSWRAHMNAVREIVQRNLSSALIMEDDVDWDVRIKDQLYDFALVSQTLTQPLRGRTGEYADPTYPKPSVDSPETPPELGFQHLPATTPATISPYGDNWDLLWVGHCGMHFPFKNGKNIPRGRVMRLDDETVAPKKNLWTLNKPFTLVKEYPEHTRAYHHVQEGVCTLAYALSQRGAQKLLHEVGLKEVTDAYDILLRFFCEGVRGRKAGRQCLTTQPTLFAHHRPAGPRGAMSDIGNHKGWQEKPLTDMIRWSVRLNADVLMEGGTDMTDQYPDKAK